MLLTPNLRKSSTAPVPFMLTDLKAEKSEVKKERDDDSSEDDDVFHMTDIFSKAILNAILKIIIINCKMIVA